MATYITSYGSYTRDIKPNSQVFCKKELEKFCGIDFNIYDLLSDEYIVTTDEDHLEIHGRNDVASILLKRDLYGPCLLVDKEEM